MQKETDLIDSARQVLKTKRKEKRDKTPIQKKKKKPLRYHSPKEG